MLVSLTVGKVDAGVTVLLTPDKRLIEFPSILLPPDISSGSIVDITVARNKGSEAAAERSFRTLQDQIYNAFGAAEPSQPVLRCRNATQTSVVLEWDPIELATADLISLALYRNNQKAGNIPRPTTMHSTKISGLAVDTEYVFHLVLRTSAGTLASDRVAVRTHKMTDLSGITITAGVLPAPARDALAGAVDRIGARLVDGVRIDTTHFVTTEGRGVQWEKAVEMNIPVVRPEWVEACEKNGRILGVTRFYLDAVRPSPMSEERPSGAGAGAGAAPGAGAAGAGASSASGASPSTEKELPEPPAGQNGVSGSGGGTGATKEESGGGSDDDDSDEGEGEDQEKVKSGGQDEQKVRADERDQQRLALRQGQSSPRADAGEGEGGESRDSGGDQAQDDKSPGGDGSSFQDVKL